MKYSFSDFHKVVGKRRSQFLFNSKKMLRAAVIQSHTNVTIATPVDTGRARGNWVVGVDAPNRSVTENVDGMSGAMAIINAQRTVEAAKQAERFILSNNLPYITELNKGYSPQAAAGFIEANVARAVTFVLSIGKVFNR